MGKIFRRTVRCEIITAAALSAVLSIALIAAPRSVLSQSNERSAGNQAVRNIDLTIPGGGRFVMELDGSGNSPDLSGGKFFDFMILFTELKEEYADSMSDDDFQVEVRHQDGRMVTNVTVKGNTFQVPGGNSSLGKLYELVGVSEQSGSSQDGRIKAPVLIDKIEPVYPETAKESGIYGDVLLTVSTDEKGVVTRVSAIRGHANLTEAAITAVSKWRYGPALSFDGMPVPASFSVTIRFLPDGTVDSDDLDDSDDEHPRIIKKGEEGI